MIQDASGGVSTIRIINLVWFFCVAAVWVRTALHTYTLPDIPLGVSGLSAAIIISKAYQRSIENPTTPPQS